MREMEWEEIKKRAEAVNEMPRFKARDEKREKLARRVLENKEKLMSLRESIAAKWGEEDKIYRFYHKSFKVYGLQEHTQAMIEAFCEIMDVEFSELNPFFREIIESGTGKEFTVHANARWTEETRPIVEAFMHAKYFLDMMIKFGIEKPDTGSGALESGWAAVQHLYNVR